MSQHMKASIFWIEGPWPGRLGIMARPRGGDWLEDEIRSWLVAKVDVVVSALTSQEAEELDVSREESLCRENGLEFVNFPIIDRSVPASRKETVELVESLEKKLAEGKNVVIHCRQGIGRAGLLAACILVVAGVEPKTAFERIGVSRGVPVPETVEQRVWVEKFAQQLVKGNK